MLQGTFETLSLPEVLGLLSSARKSGALWLDAGPITGVIHLQDGHCHATEAGDQRGPIADASDLLVRLVDVCFAVMCQESGSFRFAADEPAPWTSNEPVELSDALVEVDRLLKQWREILRVIPSLECRPRLLDALEVDEVVIDRERWSLLVAIDGRRTVRELVQRAARPVLEVCHTLLELIEAGAVGVIDPAAARLTEPVEAPRAEVLAADAAPEPPAVAEPPVEPPPIVEPAPPADGVPAGDPSPATVAPEPEPVHAPEPVPEPEPASAPVDTVPEPELAHAGHAGDGAAARADDANVAVTVPGPPGPEHADKGAFLRLFSGLRES